MWRGVLLVLLNVATATTTTTTTSTTTTSTTTKAANNSSAAASALTAPSIQANTQNVKEVQVVKVAFSVANLKHGSLNVATTTAIKAAIVSMFAGTMRTKPGNIDVAITNPFATATTKGATTTTTKAATTTTTNKAAAATTTTTAAGRRLNTAYIDIGVTIVAQKGETFATVMVPSGTAIAAALDKVDNINNAKANSALSLSAGPMSVVKWEPKATSGTAISGAALKEVKVGMLFPTENTDYFGMHYGSCGKGWIKTVKKGETPAKFSGTIADCVKLCFADICCSFISHDRFAEKCSLYKNKGCPRDVKVSRYPTFESFAISRDSERSHLVVI